LLALRKDVILDAEVFMTIRLKPEIEGFLRQKVETGQFASVEEAANELLALRREEEELTEEDIAEIRAEVQKGIEQAERGEFSQFTIAEIIAQEKAAARKQKAG
jgi:antitoxin ParD1/3/4